MLSHKTWLVLHLVKGQREIEQHKITVIIVFGVQW